MLKRSWIVLALGVSLTSLAHAQAPPAPGALLPGVLVPTRSDLVAATPLFGALGVVPAAVVQGQLGSCYFHASIAAMAQRSPELLQKRIALGDDGNYTVSFASGQPETVHLEDVVFARDRGFDRSDGLWVAVLLRGLAQNTLRSSIVTAIERSDYPSFLKSSLESAVTGNDLVIEAYDRAIRATIKQDGSLNKAILKANLQTAADNLNVPATMSGPAIAFLDEQGFFESLAGRVQENGALFGAYRGVGQGGLASRVITAFHGPASEYQLRSGADVQRLLTQAASDGAVIVALSRDKLSPDALAHIHSNPDFPDWFVAAHAYTILGYDAGTGMVTLRNPWGTLPTKDGVFQLSADDLALGYASVARSN